jgi:hypothetical protein
LSLIILIGSWAPDSIMRQTGTYVLPAQRKDWYMRRGVDHPLSKTALGGRE